MQSECECMGWPTVSTESCCGTVLSSKYIFMVHAEHLCHVRKLRHKHFTETFNSYLITQWNICIGCINNTNTITNNDNQNCFFSIVLNKLYFVYCVFAHFCCFCIHQGHQHQQKSISPLQSTIESAPLHTYNFHISQEIVSLMLLDVDKEWERI